MVRVWAPLAKRVELVLDNKRHDLEPAGRGWWTAEVPLDAGVAYQFAVDGKVAADPRSPCQPQGVHGPAQHVIHSAFPWRTNEWQIKPFADAIIYELHVGTFTPDGTFDAVIGRLDHLAKLGITHLELLPVAEFLGDHGWGYDGVYPFAPHHAYGGPDGLKRLVDAAHRRGLGMILDVVYNHLGPSGNYLSLFGPYFTDRYLTPWGTAINFDGPHSDEVREYFIDNGRMWLRDYRFDGLRLDAVHSIFDHSAVHILEQLAEEVNVLGKQLGRELFLVAESDLNDPRIVLPRERGGYGLRAQWSDDVHHAVHTMLTGEREGYYEDFGKLSDLVAALVSPFVYAGNFSAHRGRRHGRSPEGLPADAFVVYLQNHDQLGNRAQGDRITHLVNADRAKIGAALILLSPFVPMLFQGEEWAASSPFQYFVDFGSEPELAKAVREGRQREFASFGWDVESIANPIAPEAYLRSKLRWEELSEPGHQDMLNWYRALIELRGGAAFQKSRYEPARTTFDEQQGWLQLERDGLVVMVNLSDRPQRMHWNRGTPQLLISSKSPLEIGENGVVLPAESIAAFDVSSGS